VKKVLLGLMLASLSFLYVQQAVAQKQSHKEYAAMKNAECSDCHKSEGIAPNHDSDWVRGHRVLAGKGGNNCKECHEQSFCLDCHSGGGTGDDLAVENFRRDYKPKSHRSDFMEIHPLKALDNPQTCTRCHDQKYCTSCHSKFKRNDLQFQSHRRQFKDIQLTNAGPKHEIFNTSQCQTCHPGGLVPSHTWSSEHGREARRNLQACQTCHADGDVCLTCHSARTGLKVSPHPRNWGSIKGNYKDKSGGRSCVPCHDSY
jgi:hypothetical protein